MGLPPLELSHLLCFEGNGLCRERAIGPRNGRRSPPAQQATRTRTTRVQQMTRARRTASLRNGSPPVQQMIRARRTASLRNRRSRAQLTTIQAWTEAFYTRLRASSSVTRATGEATTTTAEATTTTRVSRPTQRSQSSRRNSRLTSPLTINRRTTRYPLSSRVMAPTQAAYEELLAGGLPSRRAPPGRDERALQDRQIRRSVRELISSNVQIQRRGRWR